MESSSSKTIVLVNRVVSPLFSYKYEDSIMELLFSSFKGDSSMLEFSCYSKMISFLVFNNSSVGSSSFIICGSCKVLSVDSYNKMGSRLNLTLFFSETLSMSEEKK